MASGNLPPNPLEGVQISGNQVRILVTDQELEPIALGAEDRALAAINWPHLPEKEARRRQLRTKAARKKFIQLVSAQHLPLTASFEGEIKNLEDDAAGASASSSQARPSSAPPPNIPVSPAKPSSAQEEEVTSEQETEDEEETVLQDQPTVIIPPSTMPTATEYK